MEEALIVHLKTAPPLTALVGENIEWGERRGDVALALHLIGAPPDWTLSGPSGLVMHRVQADCWGLTALVAKSVGDAFKDALPVRGQIIHGVKFQGAVVLDTERGAFGEGVNRRHRTRIDVRITTTPAI